MTAAALWCRDSGGEGPAVVLAHAIGCDHRMWEQLAGALAPTYRVVAVDARGHGRSPVPRGPYTLGEMAHDARALLDRLGIARAHWIGLSMGGMVGQAFALAHPDRLDRLVLANTTSSYGVQGRALWEARAKLVREGGLAAICDTVAQRYFSDDFRREHAKVVATVMERFMQTPVVGYLGCCAAIGELDYSRDLGRVKAPTLVIAGGMDGGTPPSMSEAIAAGIPGARLAVIDGAAHLSAVEKPEEFNALVRGFLSS